jgi:hypothetical protein
LIELDMYQRSKIIIHTLSSSIKIFLRFKVAKKLCKKCLLMKVFHQQIALSRKFRQANVPRALSKEPVEKFP